MFLGCCVAACSAVCVFTPSWGPNTHNTFKGITVRESCKNCQFGVWEKQRFCFIELGLSYVQHYGSIIVQKSIERVCVCDTLWRDRQIQTCGFCVRVCEIESERE